jgi:hypothetical protein
MPFRERKDILLYISAKRTAVKGISVRNSLHMKPFMGINSCFTECIHLDLRHMWQRPQSSAAKYVSARMSAIPWAMLREQHTVDNDCD